MKSHLRSGNKSKLIVVKEDYSKVSETETKNMRFIVPKDEFMFVYGKVLGLFVGLTNPQVRVFLRAAMAAEIETNLFRSTINFAEAVGEELKLAPKTIFNYINILYTKGFLVKYHETKHDKEGKPYIREYKAMYRINPDYAWKGGADERRKILELVVEQQEAKKKGGSTEREKNNTVTKTRTQEEVDKSFENE